MTQLFVHMEQSSQESMETQDGLAQYASAQSDLRPDEVLRVLSLIVKQLQLLNKECYTLEDQILVQAGAADELLTTLYPVLDQLIKCVGCMVVTRKEAPNYSVKLGLSRYFNNL